MTAYWFLCVCVCACGGGGCGGGGKNLRIMKLLLCILRNLNSECDSMIAKRSIQLWFVCLESFCSGCHFSCEVL